MLQSTPPRGGRRQRPLDLHGSEPVSIHAPARGATETPGMRSICNSMFQSTPPRGGRLDALWWKGSRGLVLSTPPRGGRHRPAQHAYRSRTVSIHAPARGATEATHFIWLTEKFQSTPPRGGRHDDQRCHAIEIRVSIHAPARGATVRQEVVALQEEFQSTPPRGGRLHQHKALRGQRLATCISRTPHWGGHGTALDGWHLPPRLRQSLGNSELRHGREPSGCKPERIGFARSASRLCD